MWVMVKDDPKWQTVEQMPRSSKRTKNNESGAYTSSSNTDMSVRVDKDEVEVRPINQKAAKEKSKLKRKGKAKESTSGMIKVLEGQWNELNEMMNNKAKNQEQFERLAKYDILLKDTSIISPKQREMHAQICAIIKQKHGIK